ncbi:MAG: nucleotidyltransferase family protein [Vulcanimicrobiota bacterium]
MLRLPASTDVELLRACRGDASAWRRWWSGHGADAFKTHKKFSHLLPFLYAGLGEELGGFVTVARAATLREQMRHRAFQDQASAFAGRLFLDEFALAESFHPPGVHRHCGFLAVWAGELPEGAWQMAHGREGAQRWRSPDGLVLELHHRLDLPKGLGHDRVLARAGPAALHPSDQLARTCLGGWPGLQWALDAARLAELADWSLLEDYRPWSRDLTRVLAWLKAALAVEVPGYLLARRRLFGVSLPRRLTAAPRLPDLSEPQRSLMALVLGRGGEVPQQADPFAARTAPLLQGESAEPLVAATYRRAWLTNVGRLRAATEAFGLLQQAGAEPVLLKGAALVAGLYHDGGRRPMGDVDILVRPAAFGRACQALLAAGWNGEPLGRPRVGGRHATSFEDPKGNKLDLHWVALADCRWPEADEGLWNRVRPASLEGQAVRVPALEDCLYLAVAHGFRLVDPRLALADVVALLRQPLDWEVVVAEVRRRRLEPALSEMFDSLARQFGPVVPLSHHERLVGHDWLDHLYYRALLSGHGLARSLAEGLRHLRLLGPSATPGLLAWARWKWKARQGGQ